MSSIKFNIVTRLLIFSALASGLTACGGGTPAVTLQTNTAPVATDAGVSLLPGSSVTGTLAVNDGDNLTNSIVTDTSNGTLILDNSTTGAYTYAHDGNANGDSFTF